MERPIFDAYNTRIRNNNDKISKLIRKKTSQPSSEGKPGEEATSQSEAGKNSTLQDELREPITYTPHTEAMETFKQQWIYDRIIATEQATTEFGKWLNYLDVFQGPDFEFLNPRGVIPPEAIVKVGEFHRDQLRRKKEDRGRRIRVKRRRTRRRTARRTR